MTTSVASNTSSSPAGTSGWASVRIPESPQEALRLVSESARILETQPMIRSANRMTASSQPGWSPQSVQQIVGALRSMALGYSALATFAIEACWQQGQSTTSGPPGQS